MILQDFTITADEMAEYHKKHNQRVRQVITNHWGATVETCLEDAKLKQERSGTLGDYMKIVAPE